MINFGWVDRMRNRRRRFRFLHRQPRSVVLGLYWRLRRKLGGRDVLGALLMLQDKYGVVYHSELSPTLCYGMAKLERDDVVVFDPGVTEGHYRRNCSSANVHRLIQEEASRLNLDPRLYLEDPLRDFLDRTALASH
jgi:hypothetical protein